VITLGLGFLLLGLFCARHFGRFHGGNSPQETAQETNQATDGVNR
jgi:hypothetical protein